MPTRVRRTDRLVTVLLDTEYQLMLSRIRFALASRGGTPLSASQAVREAVCFMSDALLRDIVERETAAEATGTSAVSPYRGGETQTENVPLCLDDTEQT